MRSETSSVGLRATLVMSTLALFVTKPSRCSGKIWIGTKA